MNPNPSRLRLLFNRQNGIALAALCLCAAIAVWVAAHFQLNLTSPATLMQSINELGWVGILVFIGFLMLAIVFAPIPSTPVTVAAGAVWGPVTAGIFGVIGIFLGSITAYLIARTLGRSAVSALTGKAVYLSKHRGELYLGWLVFAVHSIPVLPYELMSYGAGLSGLSFPLYASTAFLGIIPCTFFLTFMGSAFTMSLPLAVFLAVAFLTLLIILPWGIKRYNWLGLSDVIRLE